MSSIVALPTTLDEGFLNPFVATFPNGKRVEYATMCEFFWFAFLEEPNWDKKMKKEHNRMKEIAREITRLRWNPEIVDQEYWERVEKELARCARIWMGGKWRNHTITEPDCSGMSYFVAFATEDDAGHYLILPVTIVNIFFEMMKEDHPNTKNFFRFFNSCSHVVFSNYFWCFNRMMYEYILTSKDDEECLILMKKFDSIVSEVKEFFEGDETFGNVLLEDYHDMFCSVENLIVIFKNGASISNFCSPRKLEILGIVLMTQSLRILKKTYSDTPNEVTEYHKTFVSLFIRECLDVIDWVVISEVFYPLLRRCTKNKHLDKDEMKELLNILDTYVTKECLNKFDTTEELLNKLTK